MLIFYLILAHLISDYLLQPGTLVAWKNRSRWGVGVHATVHFLVTFLIGYLYTGHYFYPAIVAFAIAAIHFCIDCVKASYDKSTKYSQLAYWTDQVAHFLTITAAYFVTTQWPTIFLRKANIVQSYFDQVFFNPIFVTFSCLAIFSTLTIEFSFWHDRIRQSKKTVLLNRQHMLKRLFLVTVIYIGLLFALVPSVGFNF